MPSGEDTLCFLPRILLDQLFAVSLGVSHTDVYTYETFSICAQDMKNTRQKRRWEEQGAEASRSEVGDVSVSHVLGSCLLSAVSSEWLFSIKEGQLCLLKRDLQMEFTQCHDPWSIVWQDVADSLPSAQHTHTAENLPPLPLHTPPGTSSACPSQCLYMLGWALQGH